MHLHLSSHSISPFHGLSSSIRSLRLEYPQARPSELLGFVCSFLLLEDLALLLGPSGYADCWTIPSILPRLTGSLELGGMVGGIGPIIHRLLDLQDGLRFTKITLVWMDEMDLKLAVDLISRCSGTLETLIVTEDLPGAFSFTSCTRLIPYCRSQDRATTVFDISAARKLKHLEFWCHRTPAQWITMALQTINSKELRQITVRAKSYNFVSVIDEMIYREWGELDRLLVQFWSSHSIRPRVMWQPGVGRGDMEVCVSWLFPELTRGGLVDLGEYVN